MAQQQPQRWSKGTAAAAAEPGPALEELLADGASPSPPQEAPATVGPLPADVINAAAVEPDIPSAMESLPDELLELILSLVPTTRPYSAAKLMRLRRVIRRVSRQWARVLCSAEVWRHQTLEVKMATHLALLDPCIPALDSVEVWLRTSTNDRETVLQALATTHCKIRCMDLPVTPFARDAVATWVPRILQQHRHQLQELSLQLSARIREHPTYADPILAEVARLPELRALSLWAPGADDHRGHDIAYDMSELRTLRRLRLAGNALSAVTRESLLRANKDTLLEVDCGGYDVFDLLPQCQRLRKVTTSAIHSDSSHRLAEVRGLRTLVVEKVTAEVGLRRLVRLLDGSRDVPAELRLDVVGFEPQFTLLQAGASLGTRLRSLQLLDSRIYLSEAQLAAALGQLPHLERVFFSETRETDWDRVVDAWTEHTAPALRELHMHWRGQRNFASIPAWVRRLQEARPALRICTIPYC